jgi:hypothetical protein
VLCAHCHQRPARPRSDFCSESHRGRARRRWKRGLPADAVPEAASCGELIREAALREGEQILKPAKRLADEIDGLIERLGPDGARESIDRARARRAA